MKLTTQQSLADTKLPSREPVQVVVGIVQRDDGRFLLTTRPKNKSYAGYWEFPGGKIEAGEKMEQALARELQEEIGIIIDEIYYWHSSVVESPHSLVQLHFYRVLSYRGHLSMREGQTYSWESFPVRCAPVLPSTMHVLQRLEQEKS